VKQVFGRKTEDAGEGVNFTSNACAIEDKKWKYKVFGGQMSFCGHAADGSRLAVSAWATEHGGWIGGLVDWWIGDWWIGGLVIGDWWIGDW